MLLQYADSGVYNLDMKSRMRSAFTLIELLVVIAIIGTLGTMATRYLRSPRSKAEDVQALAVMRQAVSLIEQEAVASLSGAYVAISEPVGATADDDSWQALLDAFPAQAAQLPPVGQGYAAQSDADSYCLWRASRLDANMTIYCETGAKCSSKEGVAAGDLPADCAHP